MKELLKNVNDEYRTEQNTTFISNKSQSTRRWNMRKKKQHNYDENVDNMETVISNLSYLPD